MIVKIASNAIIITKFHIKIHQFNFAVKKKLLLEQMIILVYHNVNQDTLIMIFTVKVNYFSLILECLPDCV